VIEEGGACTTLVVEENYGFNLRE